MPDGKWVSKANLQTFWQMIRSKVLPNMVGDTVTSWLNEHVTPAGSAVVVDDTLTIQDAAADAKKTGDEISGLKEDLSESVGDLKSAISAISAGAHITDITAYNDQNGLINSAGVIVFSIQSSVRKYKAIPVSYGFTIAMSGSSSETYYALAKSYTVPTSNNTPIDFSVETGFTSRLTLAANASVEFNVPSDANYLLINTVISGNDVAPVTFSINGVSVYDLINELSVEIDNSKDEIETIDARVTALEVSEIITLQDITDAEKYPRYSGGFNDNSNTFNSLSSTHKYIVVPVSHGQILRVTANSNYKFIYAGVKSYTIPTEANQPMDISSYDGWKTTRTIKAGNESTTIIPDDVNYLLIQIQRTSVVYMPSAFYVGKPAVTKWMAMGDSITQGMYSIAGEGLTDSESNADITGNYVAWAAYLKGYEVDNKGIGGTGWIKRGGGSTSRKLNAIEQIYHRKGTDQDGNEVDIIDFLGSYPEVPYVIDFSGIDLLTVMFGINDWKGSISATLPINHGTIDSVTTPDKNYSVAYQDAGNPLSAYNVDFYDGSGIGFTETVYGNMKMFIEEVQRRNPKMKIIIISPLNSATYPTSAVGGESSTPPSTINNKYAIGFKYYNGKTLEDMVTLERTVCEHYCIQFIDLLHTSIVNILNIMSALPDKVHPSLDTHRAIGHEIAILI